MADPGIGNADDFASTRILYRQRHGRYPNYAQWKRFTERFKNPRLRWIGEVPNLDQMKNAFFLSREAMLIPEGAIRVRM